MRRAVGMGICWIGMGNRAVNGLLAARKGFAPHAGLSLAEPMNWRLFPLVIENTQKIF
jgi:hypothetical protein